MVTPQIVDYIKNTLNQGYSEDKVCEALLKKGWVQSDITEAFRIARGIPRVQPASANSSLPKDPAGGSSVTPQTILSTQQPQGISRPSQLAYRPPPSQLPEQRPTTEINQKPVAAAQTPSSAPLLRTTENRPDALSGSAPKQSLQQTQPLTPRITPVLSPTTPPAIPVSKPVQTPPTQQTAPQLSRLAYPVTTALSDPSSALVKTAPTSVVQSGSLQSQRPPVSPPNQTTLPSNLAAEPPRTPSPQPPAQIPVTAQAPHSSTVSIPSNTESLSEKPGQDTPKTKKKKTWLYILIGIIMILAVYVFAGIKFGIYAFGYNLFPLEGLIQSVEQKIGLTSPSPTFLSTKTATPNPKPTATPTPFASVSPENRINGHMVSVFGAESEAGTLADLAYSYDRKKSAYILLSDSPNLWIMDTENGTKENVLRTGQVNFPANTFPVLLAWSPDSAYIAIAAKGADAITNLYAFNTRTKASIQLTQADIPENGVSADPMLRPQWNNDGSALLVYAGGDFWKISVNGQERSRITAELPFGSFTWSPDNMRIAYTLRRTEDEKVWLMDANGKNYRLLVTGGINQLPRFNADGSRVYYISRDSHGIQDTLWSIGVDGNNPQQIFVARGIIREYTLAPQGDHVLLTIRSEGGKNSSWVTSTDRTGAEEVLPSGEYEPMGFAEWSTNGDTILTAGLQKFLISLRLRFNEAPQSPPPTTPPATP